MKDFEQKLASCRYSNSAFGALGYDGNTYMCAPAPCHAGLNRVCKNVSGPAILGNSINRAPPSSKPFYRWLVKQSPFSYCFVETEKHFERKVLFADPSYPINMIAAGFIASRVPWEFPRVFHAWNYMRERINPDIAFLLAHACQGDKYILLLDGHQAVGIEGMSKGDVTSFAEHRVLDHALPATHPQTEYSGRVHTLYSNRQGGFLADLQNVKAPARKKTGPFGEVEFNGYETEEDMYKAVLDWAKRNIPGDILNESLYSKRRRVIRGDVPIKGLEDNGEMW